MPAYEYICQDCGKEFEIRASIASYSEGLSPRCTECGSDNAVRKFGSVNVLTGSQGGAQPSGSCGPSGFT